MKHKKRKKSSKLSMRMIASGLVLLILAALLPSPTPSDDYVRERIVLLSSDRGTCTGEQVRAPSGKDYILTAAHCKGLEYEGSIRVTRESGESLMRKIIAEDMHSDLMLLEGIPNLKGLPIAKDSRRAQLVTAFTRGAGMPTYKTEGVIITDMKIPVIISQIQSSEDLDACRRMPKNQPMLSISKGAVCVLVTYQTASTSAIVPGSSGGALLNRNREVVGVASATDGRFGFFVRLKDIQNFLKSY